MPELAVVLTQNQRESEAIEVVQLITVGPDDAAGYLRNVNYSPRSGDLAVVVRYGASRILLGKVATTTAIPWTPLTLINGYGNWGGGFLTAAYRKIGDEVQLRGLVAGSGTLPLATLPVGYRPTAGIFMATTLTNNGAGRIDINPNDGNLAPVTPVVQWISLDPIRFSTS